MRSTSLVFGIFFLALAAVGCGSTAAPAGGSGGSGGSGGGGTGGGTDAGSTFMAVPPCNAQTDYMTGNMITFAMADAKYVPKCLKVSKGSMVTFSGSFETHPLKPSAKRGDKTGNPIMSTMTGSMASFMFPTAGYFAYFCGVHGFADSGTGLSMDGVVWVTP